MVEAVHMPVFWKKDKVRPPDRVSWGPLPECKLDGRDWHQIDRLLAGEPAVASVPKPDHSAGELLEALEKLRTLVDGRVTGTSWVINELLDIWAIAHGMDDDVAEPVEALLSALVERDLVGPDEIGATCDRVRAVAVVHRAEPHFVTHNRDLT
jgi:hypothetical protein